MTTRIVTDNASAIPREVAQAGSTLGTPLLLRGIRNEVRDDNAIYAPPSPGGRELEGGGISPLL